MLEFQIEVYDWVFRTFGVEVALDKKERIVRFLEEALELSQSCGLTVTECKAMVDYVFDRPIGELSQEVGGVMTCLAALCSTNGIDMGAAADTELKRILTKTDEIREKQKRKLHFKYGTPSAPADSSSASKS
jgi:NTP pyrophosphatase (non-canonical NTP hydrolase)